MDELKEPRTQSCECAALHAVCAVLCCAAWMLFCACPYSGISSIGKQCHCVSKADIVQEQIFHVMSCSLLQSDVSAADYFLLCETETAMALTCVNQELPEKVLLESMLASVQHLTIIDLKNRTPI